MDRVLVSVPVSEDSERTLRSEQILCRIMLQAPAGTVLKCSRHFLALVIPDPDSLTSRPVSLRGGLPQSKPLKFDFDDADTGHAVLIGPIGKGMSAQIDKGDV